MSLAIAPIPQFSAWNRCSHMTRRAIEQFRPRLASKPQLQTQGSASDPNSPAIAAVAASEPRSEEAEQPVVPDGGSTSEPPPPTVALELESAEAEDVTTAEPKLPLHRACLTHCKQQLSRGARVIGAPLIWLGVAAFCGGTGYAAFQWLSTIPPFPECDRIWFFTPDSDKLFCAEQAARSGKPESLQAGIKLTGQWGTSHYLYPKASRLYRDWSKQLMQVANQKALADDLDGAIQLAKMIQPDNPVYRDAKNAILEWEKLRDREHLLADTIEAALKAQDWKKAEAELQPRSSSISDYQRQQLNRLRERLLTERMAFNQLQQIQELVKAQPGNVETLGRAVQLVSLINPDSYVQEAAQRDRQQWSDTLVKIAKTRLAEGDIAGAIAVARWIPTHISLPTEVQDLVWISRVQTNLAPPPHKLLASPHLWQQIKMLAALQQIQPTSPLYALAQANASRLEQQVQDLTQLTFAEAVAEVPHVPTLNLAIQMAQSITLGRPHRIEAQTLIADWRLDIQRVQDYPYLVQARKLAKPNKIKNLQAAIAEASKISLGRALRPTAQAAIFDWKQQIQTIEDKPTLDKARQLAKQNQLPQAIQEASKIVVGRALYVEAQDAIRTWTATIQTTEDRPILEEAKALANQGNLGAAIEVAYQIAPDRALYDEAQTAIAQWTTQVAATRRSRRSFDDTPPDDTPSYRYRERSPYE